MGSCCLNILQRIFTLLGSLWLIVDLVSDIVNTKQYHDMAFLLNGNQPYYDPRRFLYNESGELLKEAEFFYASAGALILPIPAGLILILIFFIYDYSKNLTSCTVKCCSIKCLGKFCGVLLSILLLPLTFIIAIILSFLIVPIAWIFSPFLHISRALFALFGAKPAGDTGPIQVKVKQLKSKRFSLIKSFQNNKTFRRFWTFVLLLGVMEQVLEALPQTIIGGLYFYLDQESNLWSKSINELFAILFADHKTQVSNFHQIKYCNCHR